MKGILDVKGIEEKYIFHAVPRSKCFLALQHARPTADGIDAAWPLPKPYELLL